MCVGIVYMVHDRERERDVSSVSDDSCDDGGDGGYICAGCAGFGDLMMVNMNMTQNTTTRAMRLELLLNKFIVINNF